MAARQKKSFEDRVAEYVDSPQMTQRVRAGKQLSARIAGNYGVYHTVASRAKKVSGDCSCPSENWPCKHVHALRATWEANPKSFFDLDDWLLGLTEKPKAELIEIIEKMVLHSSECLSALGIPGFEDDDDYDYDYEEQDYYE
jgi:hypothetical protein